PFRGRWVNRRPLGYEPTPGPHCNRLLPIKAAETRASPSPPLGSDRRLLEGVPAQFPHNQGSLASSRRATIREAGPKLSANLDALVSSIFIPSASSRRFSTGASLLDPVLALRRDLVPCGLSVWCELDETRVSAEPLETPQLASSSSHYVCAHKRRLPAPIGVCHCLVD